MAEKVAPEEETMKITDLSDYCLESIFNHLDFR